MESDSDNDSKLHSIMDCDPDMDIKYSEMITIESDSDSEAKSTTAKKNMTSLNGLPEVSKKLYQRVYNRFMEWRTEHKIHSFSEGVIMDYFEDLATKFKSSTLWAQYSMLRQCLHMYNNIDISQYTKFKSWLKQKSDGYKPKKSKVFTLEEIETYLEKAPDQFCLATKVALVLGITGGCRRQELHQMKVHNFTEFGNTVLVTIPDVKTKMVRSFTVTGKYFDIYKKYANLRPENAPDPAFFLNYQKGKCTIQKIGVNKLGAMGKEIAKFLELPNPELYTGHCFRRSSATRILGTCGDITSLKRHVDWMSLKLPQGASDKPIKIRENIHMPTTQTNIQIEASTSAANNPEIVTSTTENQRMQNENQQNGNSKCTKASELSSDESEASEIEEEPTPFRSTTRSELIKEVELLREDNKKLRLENERLRQIVVLSNGVSDSETRVEGLLRKLAALEKEVDKLVGNASSKKEEETEEEKRNLETSDLEENFNLDLVKEETDVPDLIDVTPSIHQEEIETTSANQFTTLQGGVHVETKLLENCCSDDIHTFTGDLIDLFFTQEELCQQFFNNRPYWIRRESAIIEYVMGRFPFSDKNILPSMVKQLLKKKCIKAARTKEKNRSYKRRKL